MQRQRKDFDNQRSRLKLVVYDNTNAMRSFYSFERDERRGLQYAMTAMEQRILSKHYRNSFHKAFFINNHSDEILKHINREEVAKKINNSRIKFVVWDKNNDPHTFFNDERMNNMSNEFIMGEMSALLLYRFSNRYNAAVFYNMSDGAELLRRTPMGIVSPN